MKIQKCRKISHHFLTLWPWPLTYDLEKLIRSGHYHYQCVYQIWEQSIPWFLSYRVNTIAGGERRAAGGGWRAAGGARLRRKTITSPDPSDTGDIIKVHLLNGIDSPESLWNLASSISGLLPHLVQSFKINIDRDGRTRFRNFKTDSILYTSTLSLCWTSFITWWLHEIETFSALRAPCEGNSPVTDEFPSQRPVPRRFDVFFDMHVNKWLREQSERQWFETPSCSLWRHCNERRLILGHG